MEEFVILTKNLDIKTNVVYLSKIDKLIQMLFAERIKQLREDSKLPQKEVAELLGIDIPMYSRIERGQRKAKKEYISVFSNFYKVNEEELTQLWLADKVYDVIADENTAPEVLNLVAENLGEYKRIEKHV